VEEAKAEISFHSALPFPNRLAIWMYNEVETFVVSPSNALPFANVISHLTAEAYATSDCSPIPFLISENHSQAYIILIT
jgi:hypothetical protein